jgi:putative FmdB family regulatory protein
MPTYTARCPTCGTEVDFFRKIADRDNTPTCEHDGAQMERFITPTMLPAMGLADHYAIRAGDGNTYYGKHEYERYLKANDLVPLSEIKGEATHQRKQLEQKAKEERRADIEQAVRSVAS